MITVVWVLGTFLAIVIGLIVFGAFCDLVIVLNVYKKRMKVEHKMRMRKIRDEIFGDAYDRDWKKFE